MKASRKAMQALGGGILLLGVAVPAAYAAENAANLGLTADPSEALSDAVSAVGVAKRTGFLWTTAADALVQAEAAAKKQDSAAVIRHSAVAIEQASLGLAQREYPLAGND